MSGWKPVSGWWIGCLPIPGQWHSLVHKRGIHMFRSACMFFPLYMITGFYPVQSPFLARFEVPLRPELWSDFAAGAVSASDLQQRDDRPARQHSYHAGRGRAKSVRRRRSSSNDPSGVVGGSHVTKTRRTTSRLSGRMECPPDQSTRMTDYYHAQGEREVRPIQFFVLLCDRSEL
jgi:hypothetical protein